MTDETLPALPWWRVLLLAHLVPMAIALGFLGMMELIDRPISPAEFQADPLIGQRIADRNNGVVLIHAFLQFAFAFCGGWYVKFRRGNLALFLLIVVPFAALAFLISVIGLIAK